MKISYNWLQKHIEEPLPKASDLKEVIIFHAFEVEDTEEVSNDTIFDIKVLPDRNHDCLSHIGIARELCGLLGLTLKPYPLPKLPELVLATKVEIESDVCRRYIAIEMDNVKIGPSPKWMKELLESFGMRSINNVVDATNVVMLDRGQPVHAYDLDKIDGGVVVRMAHDSEQITTLSKEEKKLTVEDLIIADYLGPLAIAGVKGGTSAEITESTKRILIEVANFEPVSIRKTAKRLGLATDASKRFENELSPEVALGAAEHVVSLIKEVAGAEVAGVLDYYKNPQVARSLSFSLADITRLLGPSINEAQIEMMFSRYNISYKKDGAVYTMVVPFERYDLLGPADIAEEIGKMIGYDKIPTTDLPKENPAPSVEYQTISSVKMWLAQNGFREVMNYTFTKKGDVYIAYGNKDRGALRTNLSDGLKESYEKNRLNSGILALETIRAFEIGTVFSIDNSSSAQGSGGTKEEIRVATVDNGTFEELPLQSFIEKYKIDISNPINLEEFPSGTFKMWSIYPFVTRDIAVWCSSTEDQSVLENIISAFAQMYCVREPVLFDHFEKEGRTSVAYRLIFQSYEKTLTEEEVELWFSELVDKIQKNKSFEIR